MNYELKMWLGLRSKEALATWQIYNNLITNMLYKDTVSRGDNTYTPSHAS